MSSRNVKPSFEDNRDPRAAQACIASFTLGEKLEGFEARIRKNWIARQWITDPERFRQEKSGACFEWDLPKGFDDGDIIFFYFTKTASRQVNSLLRSARTEKMPGFPGSIALRWWKKPRKLVERLEQAESIVPDWAGTIICFLFFLTGMVTVPFLVGGCLPHSCVHPMPFTQNIVHSHIFFVW